MGKIRRQQPDIYEWVFLSRNQGLHVVTHHRLFLFLNIAVRGCSDIFVEPDVFESELNTFLVQEGVWDPVLILDVQLNGFEVVLAHHNGVNFIALDHTENLLLEPVLEDFIDVVDSLFFAEKRIVA